MGIPSYFAHFVREHREIIKPVHRLSKPLNNLYLDCNGFIYEGAANFTSEEALLKYVCDKLIYYINLLQPSKKVFIAFDGVAPVAKLAQQRKRRYLSWFQHKVMTDFTQNAPINSKEEKIVWNTAAITPGTVFMEVLTLAIKKRFNNPKEFGLEQFLISCADEVGEGEHKIYDYIRKEPLYHKKTTTVIYGLDADLIMLTLNHLHISEQLYLFRETPEFIKGIDSTLNPNELYLLDIPLFGTHIQTEFSQNAVRSPNAISDYIFIFFLLGNDFLPHFPSLNIRTQGINLLLNAYKSVISLKNLSLIAEGKIVWKHVRLLIAELAKQEHSIIKQEYVQKEKQSKHNRYYNNNTPKKIFEDKLINLPSTDRAIELYINPNEPGWEARYYHSLFDIRLDADNERVKDICVNYLEGLEWTFKYYNTGCVDWRWTYKYHYPPLLVDLLRYIPYFDTVFLGAERLQHMAVSPLVQLSYVLPKQNLYLLPQGLDMTLLNDKPEWYTDKCEFLWAFCKYFWEGHVKLPEIDIEELEELIF